MPSRQSYVALFAASAMFVVVSGSANGGDALSDIKKGKIVVQSIPKAKGPAKGRAMGLIEAPVAVVADVVTRFERYSGFVPRISESRQVKGNHYIVRAKLPWPVNSAWVYVRVSRKDTNGTVAIRWDMLNGTFVTFEGMAWIQPLDDERAILTYETLAVPKTRVPDRLITKGLRQTTRSMIQAVRTEAARELARRTAPKATMAAQ